MPTKTSLTGHRPPGTRSSGEIKDQCVSAGIPFFFKQWGGIRRKRNGKQALLKGTLWRMMPEVPKREALQQGEI